MHKFIRKLVSVMLTMILLISASVPAFAEVNISDDMTPEQLKQAIKGDEAWVDEYPNGLFNFAGTRFTVDEDMDMFEMAVVRQGGTEGRASVTFKAIDVSAEYGKDYVIKVPGFLRDKELEADEDSIPLIDTITEEDESIDEEDLLSDNTEETVYDEVYGDDYYELPPIKSSEELEQVKEDLLTDYTEETVYDEVYGDDYYELSPIRNSGGLKKAKEAYTGVDSDRKHWQDISENEKMQLRQQYEEFYKGTPGAEHTLVFEDGEYIKKLYFVPLDDKISESEEQVLFALTNATGGSSLGDFYSGYVNIVDNEPIEKPSFEMAEDEISVNRDTKMAEVRIRRTDGINRYAKVYVSTAARTASPNDDYIPIGQDVVFTPGMKEQTVNIPIIYKESPQDEEYFIVSLDREDENVVRRKSRTTVILRDNSRELDPRISIMAITEDENRTSLYNTQGTNMKLFSVRETDQIMSYGPNDFHVHSGATKENGYLSLNPKSKHDYEYAQVNIPSLYGIEKITYEWQNTSKGKKHVDEAFWFWQKDKVWYSTEYFSQIKLKIPNKSDKIIKTREGKVDRGTYSYNVEKKDFNANKIEFKSYLKGKPDPSDLKAYNVKLHYKPYKIIIDNSKSNEDAHITTNTWTKKDTSVKNDDKTYIGEMKIGTVYRSNTSVNIASYESETKTIYRDDVIRFEPDFMDPSYGETVYLWGYKVELKGGRYKEVEGTELKFDTKWFKDNLDKAFLEDGDTEVIVVRPIFKQKDAYVKLNYDLAKGGITGFDDGDIIKVGMGDTVELRSYGYKGSYPRGYEGWQRDMTNSEKNITKEEDLVKEVEKVFNDLGHFRAMPIANNPNIPSELDFKPVNYHNNIEVKFSKPYMTIKASPQRNGNENRGAVSAGGSEGDANTPITIEDIQKNHIYDIGSIAEDGFTTEWYDRTGDINGDGIVDLDERDSLNGYNVQFDTLSGEYFYYEATFDKPILYYKFVKKEPTIDENGKVVNGIIEGRVLVSGGTVLDNETDNKIRPAQDAIVTAGANVVYTDENGEFKVESPDYIDGKKYPFTIDYNGYRYIGYANANVASEYTIDIFNNMRPKNFKITKIIEATEDDETKYETIELDPKSVQNEDSDLSFHFDVESNISGLVAKDVIVRVYSKDHILRNQYDSVTLKTQLDDEGEPITDDVGNIIRTTDIKASGTSFTLTKNPAKEEWAPGDYMTIQVVDQYGEEYIETEVGFSFKRYKNVFSIASSFKSPLEQKIELLGKTDSESDLGISGMFDDYFTANDDTLTLQFGFDYGRQGRGDSKKDTIKGLKDVAKNGDDWMVRDSAKESLDDKTVKKRKSNITTFYDFNLNLGLNVVMKYDEEKEDYYFKEMVLVAGISDGQFSVKYQYMTPIFVPVFIKLEVKGDISAVMVIEQYKDKKFFFNEEGEIDLRNAGTTSIRRDFTIYGKFMIHPTIIISAGAGVDLLNVAVDGEAAFDLNFTTLKEGYGSVTLTSNIVATILGHQKKWKIAGDTYSLFGSEEDKELFSASLLSTDHDNALYESADTFTKMPRDYLENQSGWGGKSQSRTFAPMSLFLDESQKMTVSDDNDEEVLKSGVYPYPDSKLIELNHGRMLLLFLDDDGSRNIENRASLKYSIFDGSSWGEPEEIDDDGTLDADPNVFDLGDELIISWSSAGKAIDSNDSILDTLRLMDIKTVFFDKDTERFGPVTQLTKLTEEDYCSDTQPKVAYDEDTDRIIMYYTKTEYTESGTPVTDENSETVAVVGDIMNGYSVIAYRYYENGKWNDSYTDEEMERFSGYGIDPDRYLEQWYGQRFLDLATMVSIIEEDIYNEDGELLPGKDQTIVPIDGLNDPKVLESTAASYNGLSLFAYSMDADQDVETDYDQEIYLQIYNFEEDSFTHPIQITNNGVSDRNPQMIRLNGITYLYWLSDGNIVYIDASNLVKNGLKKEVVKGKAIYIIDKSAGSQFTGYNIAALKEENLPIDNYMVKTDGDSNVYLIWSDYLVRLKDGVEEGSDEAANIRNQYQEKQLFAVKYEENLVRKETTFKDENGNTIVYPEKDANGNPIKEGINGEAVNAGDVVVLRERVPQGIWGKPIQLTDEKGANISDLSYVVLPNGDIKAVYVSYEKDMVSIRDDQGGRSRIQQGDLSNRKLVLATFEPNHKLTLNEDDILLDLDKIKPNSNINVTASVTNKGLESAEDVKMAFYQVHNGKETEIYEHTFVNALNENKVGGGERVSSEIEWSLPEDLEDLAIKVVVSDSESVVSSTKDIELQEILTIDKMETRLISQNEVQIDAKITNNGSKLATNSNIDVYGKGQLIGSTAIDELDIGESTHITFIGNITEDMFEPKETEDETLVETIEIELISDGDSQISHIERRADANILEIMDGVSDIVLNKESIRLIPGSTEFLTARVISEDKGAKTEILWSSSNPNIASIDQNGGIYAYKPGRVTITAQVVPVNNNYILTKGRLPQQEDQVPYLPSSILKSKEISLQVYDPNSRESDEEGGGERRPTGIEDIENINSQIVLASDNETISQEIISRAIESMSDNQAIILKAQEDFKKITVQLPAAEILKSRDLETVILAAAGLKVALPKEYFRGNDLVGISIERFDLSEGDKPVFRINRIEDGQIKEFNNRNIEIPLEVPYTSAYTEMGNRDFIIIANIIDGGKLQPVINSYYDSDKKTVVTTLTEFGDFKVLYNPVSFADTKGAWFDKPVNYLAARGIINGVGYNRFAPQENITRADFVTMLMRMLDVDVNAGEVFNDVDAGKYYANAVLKARGLGIITGVGDNRFNPEAPVTRQDMFTITERALTKLNMIEVPTDLKLKYSDKEKIAGYAQQSIAILSELEIVQGANNNINPASNAKRSETAQFIYNILRRGGK